MPITVLKNNVPWGPFTRGQVEDGLARGDFTLQYLAHGPGMKEWLPLGEVLDHFDRAASLPPVPGAAKIVPAPGPRDLPPSPGFAGPALEPPAPAYAVRSSGTPPPIPHLSSEAAAPAQVHAPLPTPPEPRPKPAAALPILARPASFFRRFIAFAIDCAVLFVPVLFVYLLSLLAIFIRGHFDHDDPESTRQANLLLWQEFRDLLGLVAIGGAWLYAAFLECSHWQGTVGKRWMGIKVTDANGERLSFFRATGRHAAKFLSALPLFLGFTMALFNSQRLALHDRLASTRVVTK